MVRTTINFPSQSFRRREIDDACQVGIVACLTQLGAPGYDASVQLLLIEATSTTRGFRVSPLAERALSISSNQPVFFPLGLFSHLTI